MTFSSRARSFSSLTTNRPLRLIDLAFLAVPAVLLQPDVARLQQVMLEQLLHEPLGARDVLLEFAEETHGLGQHLAVGAVFHEQALAFAGVEAFVALVEEHGEVVAFLPGRLFGQHERIAAHEGRDVDVRRPLAFGIDVQVFVLAQAQQGHRTGFGHGRAGEHDQQVARGDAELHAGQRHRMRVHRELHVRHALQAQILVFGTVERHRVLVEKNFSHVTYLCPRRAGSPPKRPYQTRRRVCVDWQSYQRFRAAATVPSGASAAFACELQRNCSMLARTSIPHH